MARFWEFQQLQDDFKGMTYCDQVPRAGKLFIGGLSALYQEPDPLHKNGITHVLSVLDFDVGDTKQLNGLKHLHIRLEDDPAENLLKHFPRTNAFIDEALSGQGGGGGGGEGGVFVHCAMGVSRSATVVCAFLMWKFRIGREEALGQLREGRERCFPNHGFWEQLGVYEEMLKVGTERERDEIVRKWARGKYPPTKL